MSFLEIGNQNFKEWLNLSGEVNDDLIELYKKYFNVVSKYYLTEYKIENSWRDFVSILSSENGIDQKSLANWLEEKGIRIIQNSLTLKIQTGKSDDLSNIRRYYEYRLKCALEDAEEFHDTDSLYLAVIDVPVCIRNDLSYIADISNKILSFNPWEIIKYLSSISKPANEQALFISRRLQ